MKVGVAATLSDVQTATLSRPVSLTTRAGRAYKRDAPIEAFVLDAYWRQGLVTVRSLGRAGVRIGAVDCVEIAAFNSRWCSICAIAPEYTREPDMHVNALIELLQRYPARVLIPTADGSIEALRARRADIECYARLALGSEAALDTAVSKPRTLAIAQELGIAVPRSIAVTDTSEVSAAMREVGYPAVVKPIQSWVEKDGIGTRLVCEAVLTDEEAKRRVDEVLRAGGGVVLQQWLPGAREAVSMLYAGGTVWARFAQVAHRMLPPLGGSSISRESIPLPRDAADDAERLIRAINLEGYAEIEFRRDAKGRPVLMEINPRLSGSVEMAVCSGVNFPLMLYRWAAGEPLQETPGYRAGLRMRWLGGDLRYLKDARASQGRPDVPPFAQAVRTFALDFLRPTIYDYVDFGDMQPALYATREMVQRSLLQKAARTGA